MSGKEKRRRRRNWLFALRRYLTFFVLMAFVITCCMLLFLNTITRVTGLEFSQEYVEAAAKVTFLNILLLALVCTLIDGSPTLAACSFFATFSAIPKEEAALEELSRYSFESPVNAVRNVSSSVSLAILSISSNPCPMVFPSASPAETVAETKRL